MRNFVFITDLHLSSSCRVRTGDTLEDLAKKLEFVRDYCNKENAILLIGGDVFDKATVPDLVKNRIFPILRGFTNPILACPGNHDELYGNKSYNFKTSFQTLVSSGIVTDLDVIEGVDFDDVFVTSLGPWEEKEHQPLITRNKPQIVIFHGFLNTEDGVNTFRYTDILTKDKCVICLGHDHVEYENLQFTDQVRIIRPGSFLRGVRTDTSKRTPNLIHIRVKDGNLLTKRVEIPSRPWEEIFTSKEVKLTKSQTKEVYDDLISQIRKASSADMTLEQALSQVTTPEVISFLDNVLEEAKNEITFKRV